ncbi:MAG: T9SS type A sorting domain-containing protein [Bacteroidetes bacterium]|nr:T9SS type A sorting domain-containing protein [Bacteroidota bacterium]
MKSIVPLLLFLVASFSLSAQCPTVSYTISQEPHSWGNRVSIHTTNIQHLNIHLGEIPFVQYYYITYLNGDSALHNMNSYTDPTATPTGDIVNQVDSFTIGYGVVYVQISPLDMRMDSGCREERRFALEQFPTTDISDLLTGDNIKFYPVPATDHLTIDMSNYESIGGYKVKVYDVLGQVMYEREANVTVCNIDITAWSKASVYALEIRDIRNNIISKKKVILQ